MTTKRRPHIAIIGAGIGGTTAAALLQKAGYRCTVFEQSSQFLRLGAGINFAPNGTRVFHAMGLGDVMRSVGIHPKIKANRTFDTGEQFFAFDNWGLLETYGSEFMAFHRADLHDMLHSAVDPDSFEMNKRLKGIEAREDDVVLSFEDGTTVTVDAVVGADGLRSRVREHLFGPQDPVYFGHVAYRAIVPSEAIRKVGLEDYIRWWGPQERYVLIYCMNEDRDVYNIVASGAEALTPDEYHPMPMSADHMRSMFTEFCDDTQLVLENCIDVIRWPMMVRPPQPGWSRGRITLLGDAAHPMTPHLGQGGGMAVEDAAMLMRCLEAVEGEDVPEAFRLYEATRYERTAEVQIASQENKIGRGARDPQWLFAYDVMNVPIAGTPVSGTA
ncbi:FAD-dependent monooxygenase [Acuticoccus kandeliae]|uniref:FAD-dependent monooxygenase n=1 Tax=Acuticoccus kandeliae TaxID=2073160 RepID=UPI0013006A03|nr:FAD-dependent monooxygenase [Acuticoccus kandeliae]